MTVEQCLDLWRPGLTMTSRWVPPVIEPLTTPVCQDWVPHPQDGRFFPVDLELAPKECLGISVMRVHGCLRVTRVDNEGAIAKWNVGPIVSMIVEDEVKVDDLICRVNMVGEWWSGRQTSQALLDELPRAIERGGEFAMVLFREDS